MIAPVVREPLEVMLPVFNEVEKRFVDEAVVLKKLVLVEFVVVEVRAVKFCRVVEPRVKNPVEYVTRPFALMEKIDWVLVA